MTTKVKLKYKGKPKLKQPKSPIGYVRFAPPDEPLQHPLDRGFFLYEDLCGTDSKQDCHHHFLNADYYLNKFFNNVKDPWRIEGLIKLMGYVADYIQQIQRTNPDAINSLSQSNNWLILEERLKRIKKEFNVLNEVCERENKRVFSKKAKDKSFEIRNFAKRAICTLFLNQHAFKYCKTEVHPAWVEDCKKLPPFNKTTWMQWASIVRAMIHADMPDIYEYLNQNLQNNYRKRASDSIHTKKQNPNLDGKISNLIIDDIVKAVRTIAISSRS